MSNKPEDFPIKTKLNANQIHLLSQKLYSLPIQKHKNFSTGFGSLALCGSQPQSCTGVAPATPLRPTRNPEPHAAVPVARAAVAPTR